MTTLSIKRTHLITSVASFAALYAVLLLIPTFPIIGIPGAHFPLADAITPVYGIILGPIVGPISVVIANFFTYIVKPSFFGLGFLPEFFGIVVVALILRGNYIKAFAIYLVLLLTFVLHPLALPIISVKIGGANVTLPYHWLHIVTLALLAPPITKKVRWWVREPTNHTRLVIGTAILSLTCVMTMHSTGGVLWMTLYGNLLKTIAEEAFPEIWSMVFWLYPIERAFMTFVATIVGVPVVKVLAAAKLPLLKELISR